MCVWITSGVQVIARSCLLSRAAAWMLLQRNPKMPISASTSMTVLFPATPAPDKISTSANDKRPLQKSRFTLAHPPKLKVPLL